MVQSLTQPADFRRLLQRRPLAKHAGWSLHACRPEAANSPDLSTRAFPPAQASVDDWAPGAAGALLDGSGASEIAALRADPVDLAVQAQGAPVLTGDRSRVPRVPARPTVWTGVVLSRRNVRRAASRNLMRRLWRAMLAEAGESAGADGLDGWQVLLRRTAPWSRETFRSTQSAPMRRQLRTDLSVLLAALIAAPLAGMAPSPARVAAPAIAPNRTSRGGQA